MKSQVSAHIHACHDHPSKVDLDALCFDSSIPCSSNRSALEDRQEDHDAAVRCDEGPYGI